MKSKKFNKKINHYLKNKKDDKNRFSKLNRVLKEKAQFNYINKIKKEKQNHSSKQKSDGLPSAKVFVKDIFQKIDKNLKSAGTKIKAFSFTKTMVSLKQKGEKVNIFSLLKLNNKNLSKKKIMMGSGAFVMMFAIAVFSKIIIDDTTGYKVSFNGEEIGMVKNKETVFYLVDIIEDKLDIAYNADIIIDKENITFEKIQGFGLQMTPDDEILGHFTYFQNLEVKSYCLYIEDHPLANFSSKKQIDQLLIDVQEVYLNQDDEYIKYEEVSFLEDVEIKEEEIILTSLSNSDSMLDYILKGTKEEKKHKVKKGENYWTIAEKYNIKPEELEAANPKVKPERLQIGQEISLIVPKPLLTVITKEKVTYSENIPFEISYEDTGALFKDEKNVKLKGKNGKKEILANVERHNGIEVKKEEIDVKVLEEPITQVVLVGTKDPPPLIGTGSFDNPARGSLTSRYGMRWGRMHSGIDIAASIGTDVRAADGGVVTFAGWKGNYGLTVIIDHGQNKTTLYAHCNKLMVKKGQKVYKGQKIGEVGNTGRTTGPHVHFEVRVNKKTQNPLKYVSY